MELAKAVMKPDPTPDKEASETPTLRERFSVLMRQHHRELLVYANAVVSDHHAAEDLVQDAFVTAYQKFETFESHRDFGAWMRGIVRNKARDWFRKQGRSARLTHWEAGWKDDFEAWDEARASGSCPVWEALERCLKGLPDRLRESIEQYYLKDQGGDQAADVLAIAPATLRKRLERARAQLHGCITQKLTPSAA